MPAFVALARTAVLSANLRPHVQPVDDKADVKTAEVISALIRNTEHLSQVEAVYATAIDSMSENGRGYVQVVTEYTDDESFEQRPRLKRPDARDEDHRRLQAKLGELLMETELLYAKVDQLEAGGPLARRRSRR